MYTMDMSGRKWEIFKAAVHLFSKHSYEGISMRDIAEVVGVQVSSLYHYFKSKESIMDTIYDYLESFYQQDWIPTPSSSNTSTESLYDMKPLRKQWYWPEDMKIFLQQILGILLSRIYFDSRAYELFQLTTTNWAYIIFEPVMQNLISEGQMTKKDAEAYLEIKVALDIYATLRFVLQNPLSDQVWENANSLLIKAWEINSTGKQTVLSDR